MFLYRPQYRGVYCSSRLLVVLSLLLPAGMTLTATSGLGFSGRAFEDYLGQLQVVVVRVEDGLVATVPRDDPRLEAAQTIIRNAQRRLSELNRWVRKNPSDPSVTVANSLVAESDLASLAESFLDATAIEGPETAQRAVENGDFHITLAVKLLEKLQGEPVVGKKASFLKTILWNLIEVNQDIKKEAPAAPPPSKCTDIRKVPLPPMALRCVNEDVACEDSQAVKDLADSAFGLANRVCGEFCAEGTDCPEGECCIRRADTDPRTTIVSVEDDSACPDEDKSKGCQIFVLDVCRCECST